MSEAAAVKSVPGPVDSAGGVGVGLYVTEYNGYFCYTTTLRPVRWGVGMAALLCGGVGGYPQGACRKSHARVGGYPLRPVYPPNDTYPPK